MRYKALILGLETEASLVPLSSCAVFEMGSGLPLYQIALALCAEPWLSVNE